MSIPQAPMQSAPIRKCTHVFDNNGSFLLALFEFFIFFA